MTKTASPRLLLTGFEPFAHFATNPSQVLVESLPASAAYQTLTLPVDFEAVAQLYPLALEKTQPDFIINMGLNASANVIHLEQRAANYYRSASGQGLIRTAAPDALFTAFDTQKLAHDLCLQGIPAAVSTDAGDYLCNFTYFYSLSYLQQKRGTALFLHLPFSSEIVAELCLQGQSNYPSLPMDYLRRALLFCVEQSLAEHNS